MEREQLTVKKREEISKRATKALRREGYIPATMFGRGVESISFGVDRREFLLLLKKHGGHCAGVLIDIKVEGNGASQTVLVEKAYRNPLTREYDNLDLHVVHMDEMVHVLVPVLTEGDPAGVKEGGLIEHVRRDVDVKCLPDAIPEHLHMDISGLHIGQTGTVADIRPLPGVEIVTPADELIVAVRAKPKQEEVAAPAATEVAPADTTAPATE